LVIVDIDNRSSRPSDALRECDIEEQAVSRGETAKAEDLFMSDPCTI
jgi:hypothetical protein